MHIIKDNIRYELVDGLKLELPFTVYLGKREITIAEKYNYFKRVVGAINSNFKMVFTVISDKERQYFYLPEKDLIFNNEKEVDSFVRFFYNTLRGFGGK